VLICWSVLGPFVEAGNAAVIACTAMNAFILIGGCADVLC